MRSALHKEIANELRDKINSGELRPGQQVPTEPELEKVFGASRNTIRLAVSTLVHEGLIQLQPGKGMFVPDGPIPFLVNLSREEGGEGNRPDLASYQDAVHTAGRDPSIRDFETRIEYPSREVAGWLEINEDAQVVVRATRRFIDSKPYSLQSSYYPMELVRGTEIERRELIQRGTIRALAEIGYPQSGYRDEHMARMPTPEEKRFFRIGPGVPVIVVHRIAYSVGELPIRLTMTTYAADRNRLSYDVGDVPERRMRKGQISTVG